MYIAFTASTILVTLTRAQLLASEEREILEVLLCILVTLLLRAIYGILIKTMDEIKH